MEKEGKGKEPVPVFYRNGNVTVCLLVTNPGKVVSRGVSICSEDENYEPKVGMAKSKGKAMQARHHRKNVAPVRENFESGGWEDGYSYWPANLYQAITDAKEKLGFELNCKGMYKPRLTKKEEQLAETMESETLENKQEDFDNIFKRVFDKVRIVVFRM